MPPDDSILITGSNGFTGAHLVRYLRSQCAGPIVGLDIASGAANPVDEYFACDLTDAQAVHRVVSGVCPSVVYHLAARTQGVPDEVIERTNVEGFRNLRDALAQVTSDRPIRMVTIGSAAEIGSRGAAQSPISEDVTCEPETAYGRSKWQVTQLALAEPADSDLRIVVARPFNLLGPGLPASLSLGHFARQVAAVASGRADGVNCGPLDARRDYLDVRDAVRAYVALAECGRAGQVYNVCSGRSYRVGELLDTLIRLAGVTVPVQSDIARHPVGVPDIYGDNTKLKDHTGWQPRVSIEQSLKDLLESASADLCGELPSKELSSLNARQDEIRG